MTPIPEALIVAARFALKECEEITSCYPNAGDFWGLADNAATELRKALAGEEVSAFAKAVTDRHPRDIRREFILCEETGALAYKGVCPVHRGDACLKSYEPVRAGR